MGEDPTAVRAEIAQTRAEMGDTMEAIGYKTDVKARAEDYVAEKKEAVTEKASAVTSGLKKIVPSREGTKRQAERVGGAARGNPIPLAVGAAAAGLLVGLAIPSTRTEDERLGPTADSVKEQAKEAGQEALERGKAVAQEASQQATETIKERGAEEGQALAASAQQRATGDASSESP
jgi:hypothetical protein